MDDPRLLCNLLAAHLPEEVSAVLPLSNVTTTWTFRHQSSKAEREGPLLLSELFGTEQTGSLQMGLNRRVEDDLVSKHCEQCGAKDVEHRRRQTLVHSGDFLVNYVCRVTRDGNGNPVKDGRPLSDFTDISLPGLGNFSLVSCAVHQGRDPNSGHWRTLGRDPQTGTYHVYDDAYVGPIDVGSLSSKFFKIRAIKKSFESFKVPSF